MKKITLAAVIAGIAVAGAFAASQSAIAQVSGLAPVALEQTLGHEGEGGECGRGDHDSDRDGDRC